MSILIASCASQKPKGMRKSKKKKCDCPSFSTIEKTQQSPNTYLAFNGKKSD